MMRVRLFQNVFITESAYPLIIHFSRNFKRLSCKQAGHFEAKLFSLRSNFLHHVCKL